VARGEGLSQTHTLTWLLSGMTSAVVVYDRITEQGVFARGGGVGVSKHFNSEAVMHYYSTVVYAQRHPLAGLGFLSEY
jgi:hypothetical protein